MYFAVITKIVSIHIALSHIVIHHPFCKNEETIENYFQLSLSKSFPGKSDIEDE